MSTKTLSLCAALFNAVLEARLLGHSAFAGIVAADVVAVQLPHHVAGRSSKVSTMS
jgi:hypothetical protein